MTSLHFQLLANLVLTLHLSLVLFVIFGLVFVVVGNLRGWGWVNNLWFRLAHLAAIAVVVAEAWLGITCPLTTWEMWLREQAQISTYDSGFIQHWLRRLLYYNAPLWVFTLCYSLFGLCVLASWWFFPPMRKRNTQHK